MTPEDSASYIADSVVVILMIVSVLIVPGLIGGLIISILQAATQINEQTLSFLPRLIITFVALLIAGHWIIQLLCDLFVQAFLKAGHLFG